MAWLIFSLAILCAVGITLYALWRSMRAHDDFDYSRARSLMGDDK
jgi:hypothetical protein